MRVIKPTELSAQIRPFQTEGQGMLALGVLVGFPFDATLAPYSEQDLWALASDYLSDWDVFDEGMPKLKSEYLVYGSYFSKTPMAADQVQVQVGELNKTLKVTGRREWRKLLGSTNPEPFTEMPITFDKAYGGETVEANLVGMGADGVLLPQIEHPDSLFTNPKKNIVSAGLTARNILWAPRKDQWGTYNERWLQNDSPGFARDIQWDIFQLAPEDQWKKEGFWQGGESFRIKNMHSEKKLVEGVLPDIRVRLFALKGEDFFELNTVQETAWLFPNDEAQISCYRGQVAIETFDGAEIFAVLLAYENVNDERRSLEHYSAALLKRLEPEGDIDDPDDFALRPNDVALRPNSEALTELHPVPPPDIAEALLPGAAGAMGLGALAALAKMKGGKGGAEPAAAGEAAEAKVDDAAAPEVAGGAGASEAETAAAEAEATAKAEAAQQAKDAENEELAEAMAAMDELMSVMSDEIAKVDVLKKATLEGMGVSPELMANLGEDGGLGDLINAALPPGAPTADKIADPDALAALLEEPAALAKEAAAAGIESAALGENKQAIDQILAGEPLSDDQLESLTSDAVMNELSALTGEADLENAVNPKVMSAINKSLTPKK